MIRYCKQRDDYSCVPVAILNALKWQGRHVTLKDLPYIKEKVGTTYAGTSYHCWKRKVAKLLKGKIRPLLKWHQFKKELETGKVFIIDCEYKHHGVWAGHGSFVSGIKDKKVIAHNFYENESTSLVPFREFKKYYKKNRALFEVERIT